MDAHEREAAGAAAGMAEMYGPRGLADCYGRVFYVGDRLTWARDGWPAGLTMTSTVKAIDGDRYVVSEDGIQHYVTTEEVMPI